MKEGLVSIMIPVYNGMPDIQLSIKSLLLQTYTNWECIIINDGSTDGTKEYIDSLTDSRFIVYHFPENRGRPYARQKGLDIASGEYIAMLDADDYYHPQKLEIQVSAMTANPDIFLVGTGVCSFGKRIIFLRIRKKGNNEVNVYLDIQGHFPATNAAMIRTEYAKKYKYDLSLKLGQDLDFLKRYLIGRKYLVVPNVLYYYSEFDSVNINKIQKTHYYGLVKAIKEKNLNNILILGIKMLVSTFIFPILGINFILRRRGIKPTIGELEEFNQTISLINNIN